MSAITTTPDLRMERINTTPHPLNSTIRCCPGQNALDGPQYSSSDSLGDSQICIMQPEAQAGVLRQKCLAIQAYLRL